MSAAYLEKIDPDKNQRRFYAVRVEPTLFGQWAAIKSWGRIGSRGQSQEAWFDDVRSAESQTLAWQALKERRGYLSVRETV